MLIHRIKLQNLLSFGPDAQELELKPLNVLIGPNGSGKSNLIEALALLRAAPMDLPRPIREGGGVSNWIWRGDPAAASARLEVVIANPPARHVLRYALAFAERGQRFELTEEVISDEPPGPGEPDPYRYFEFRGGNATLRHRGGTTRLRREDIEIDQSILAQRKDPDRYPELTYLGNTLREIPVLHRVVVGQVYPASTSSTSRSSQ